ncbi:MAG: hypothetical protein JNM94_00410 [Phycisphaerae bacterium]|nr:hypothetical protein [Phycisphaerae bacterium]
MRRAALLPLLLLLPTLAGCASNAQVEFRAASLTDTPGSMKLTAEGLPRPVYVSPTVIISNDDIASAVVDETSDGQRSVHVTLNDAGAKKFEAYTSAHLEQPIAIFVDGEFYSAPIVKSPLSRTAIITGGPGGLTEAEATRLVKSLNG